MWSTTRDFKPFKDNDTCSSLTAKRRTTINQTQARIYKHDVQQFQRARDLISVRRPITQYVDRRPADVICEASGLARKRTRPHLSTVSTLSATRVGVIRYTEPRVRAGRHRVRIPTRPDYIAFYSEGTGDPSRESIGCIMILTT
jgi:hypothetical protein